MGLREEDHKRNMSFPLHHIRGRCYQYDITADLSFDHLANVMSIRFLWPKVTLPLVLCYAEKLSAAHAFKK